MPEDVIQQPGKFEGEWIIAPTVYEMEPDEDMGDEETGYYALYRFSDEDRDALIAKHPLQTERILELAGAIALENSQGFVSFHWFKGKEALERAWNKIQKEIEESEA